MSRILFSGILLALLTAGVNLTFAAGESSTNIVIIKHEFKLYVYNGKNLVKEYPIAVGKEHGDKRRQSDKRTPLGNFRIDQIKDSHALVYDAHDGKGPIKGIYGPWYLRLYTGRDATKSGKSWKGIAIHGTLDDASIGTMASEGCVRLHNNDITELKGMVRIGTKVRIQE